MAAGAASLAGCANPLRSDDPGAMTLGRQWASAYEGETWNEIRAGFVVADTDALLPALPDDHREHLGDRWRPVVGDPEMGEVDAYATDYFEKAPVYYGLDGFDEVLAEEGYERDGSYEGFDWYARPDDRGWQFAVDGATVVTASRQSILETALDVGVGDRPGAARTSDQFSRLVELTERGQYVTAATWEREDVRGDPLGGTVGRSDAITVSDDTFDLRTVLLFERSEQVETEALREEFTVRVQNGKRHVNGLSSFDLSADGRHVVLTGSGPVSKLAI
jgi:hypothetical protein